MEDIKQEKTAVVLWPLLIAILADDDDDDKGEIKHLCHLNWDTAMCHMLKKKVFQIEKQLSHNKNVTYTQH